MLLLNTVSTYMFICSNITDHLINCTFYCCITLQCHFKLRLPSKNIICIHITYCFKIKMTTYTITY